MTPTQATTTAEAALTADIPCFLWGAPGIGKSDVVRQLAAKRNVTLIDMRAVLLDPVDLRGLPSVANGKAVWCPMGELPDEKRDGPEGILFLDELNAAPPMVQAACFGLVLDRKLGEYRLPAGWRIIAAGNRQSDRASAQRMPSALANRFMHIEVEADVDAWVKWAIHAGLPVPVVQFIRMRPELLHDFSPDRNTNPTPRTWAMAGKVVDAALPAEVELPALSGILGDGPAAELTGFLRVFRNLPSPDGILMDPTGSDVPEDGATLFALTGALARRVSEVTVDNFVTYLSRLPREFSVRAMIDAVTRNKSLQHTRAFTVWASENDQVIV